MRGLEAGHEDILMQALLDLLGVSTLEKQLDGFSQIGERRLHRWSLASHIEFRAQRHVQIVLPFKNRCEASHRHVAISFLFNQAVPAWPEPTFPPPVNHARIKIAARRNGSIYDPAPT